MAGAEGRVTLVLGGARSGKSAFAQQLAERGTPPVLFVATATIGDDEMADRIAAHRAERPPHWRTLEAPLDVSASVRTQLGEVRTVLLDCLSLLVSNVLLTFSEDTPGIVGAVEKQVAAEVQALLTAARQANADLIVVSNEVGMSVVPPSVLGRAYRDALGRANQQVAAAADAVFLVVAGIPVDVKRLAIAVEQRSWPV